MKKIIFYILLSFLFPIIANGASYVVFFPDQIATSCSYYVVQKLTSTGFVVLDESDDTFKDYSSVSSGNEKCSGVSAWPTTPFSLFSSNLTFTSSFFLKSLPVFSR